MKNLTATQIEQVKKIKVWNQTKFNGNRKKVGALLINDYQTIVAKKLSRKKLNEQTTATNKIDVVKNLISIYKKNKGTDYEKVIIAGSTSFYFASPVYGHTDYNKTRLFEINESTTKLVEVFNKIANKN